MNVVPYTGVDKAQYPEKVTKNQKMLNEEKQIKEKLADLGHSTGLAFYLPNEKVFTVGIKTEKEILQHTHSEVKQQVSEILQSFSRDNYEVEVFRYIENTSIEKASYGTWSQFPYSVGRKSDIVNSYLEEAIGTKGQLSTALGSNRLTVYADTRKTDVDALIAELPEKIETVNFGTFNIDVRVVGGGQTNETIPLKIARKLTIALAGQQDLHVKNVGASYENNNFQIYVNTSLDNKDKSKEIIVNIENQIQEFFSSKEGKESLQHNDYKIHFKDKNGEILSP